MSEPVLSPTDKIIVLQTARWASASLSTLKSFFQVDSASGPTGPTGPTGIGITGVTGVTGISGVSITGATGPTGIGVTGATGVAGGTGGLGLGLTGATGPTGGTGAAGAAGTTGATGPTGGTGGVGATGGTGAAGGAGASGTAGSVGATGATGPTGVGTTGATGSSGVGAWDAVMTVTGSDATTTGTTLVDVTGLTYAVAGASRYEFEAMLMVATTAVTTGTKYGIGYTGTLENLVSALITGATSVATSLQTCITSGVNAKATPSAAFLITASEQGTIQISGHIWTGAAGGALSIQHLKVTSGTSTVRIGSTLKIRKTA